jgi:TonB-dependent receptor
MSIGNSRFRASLVWAIIVAAFSLTFQPLYAAGSGSIKGHVFDKVTGDPLIGANVVVLNTSLGASADIDGLITIYGVPAGQQTLRISYVGYRAITLQMTVPENGVVEQEFRLLPQAIEGQEVVVTAQASGQNAAINQQLASDKIENIVSAARIQELPDANAAESIGRLPGVSLIRSGGSSGGVSGGEATEVVIRGLQPQYNMIMVNGVEIPATNTNDRGTNLSMMSSNMLEGIEVSKTVTPDMDAAVFGGTVNFDIREAKETSTGAPLVSLLAQGGYTNLINSYNNYKFVVSIENRFFDNRFGVFAQGIVQRQNLASDELVGNYYIPVKPQPQITALSSMDLYFYPTQEQRYDGTLVLDYKLPDGKIVLTNLFSQGNSNTQYNRETYELQSNDIQYEAQYSPNKLNVITNILNYEQRLFSFKIDASLSHSYSENITPNSWWMSFEQTSAGIGNIPNNESPMQVAQAAAAKTDFNNMTFRYNSTWSSFNKQRNLAGSIDLERDVDLSDLLTVIFKAGGSFKYTDRYYNTDNGSGNVYGAINEQVRASIIAQNPWMAQPPYNLNPNGVQELPITMFLQNTNFGHYLNGNYLMNAGTNIGLISSVMDNIIGFGRGVHTAPTGGVFAYLPNVYGSLADDYSGLERRNAGYIMATVNIGPEITFIPGVRYQGLQTSYTAAHFWNASETNPYPNTQPHTDTTVIEYHGYWLPDASLKYSPFSWLNARLAYTSTLSYPDFNTIIPRMDVFSSTVTWNNYALKPARSQNYDLQVSTYDNNIGLLSAGGFLKQIDDFVFYTNTSYITNPSKYPGIPSYTKGFQLTTYINDPYRVNLWGIEAEWQTHFWYLPNPLNGLVLDVNYTHIFSSANYPWTVNSGNSGYPKYQPIYTDSSYVDRLINQPNDIVNLSVGYDYKKFSIRASMIYQSDVFNNTNFYNSLRSDKVKYLRWDFSVKQGLPWFGVEVFADLNNINSENDTYSIRGPGSFPNQEWDYGMTADLGLRWKL